MGQNRNTALETKMLYLIALLSKYGMFHVSTTEGREFNCTKIDYERSGHLKFQRLFSTSIFSDCPIAKVEAFKGYFICTTQKSTYTITPLEEKSEQTIIRAEKDWSEISDLMDLDYIGERFTTYLKQLDIVILVVDPQLLGELSVKEQMKIKRLINVFLGGSSISMQMCRTVCFQVRINDPRNRIYAGVFDLERKQSISSVPLYDEYDKEVVSNEMFEKAKALTLYSKNCIRFT